MNVNILDQLTEKLKLMSKEFYFLLDENEKLRAELDSIKNKNDLFERSNQDAALLITNMLQKDGRL